MIESLQNIVLNNIWILQIFCIILATLVLNFIVQRVISNLIDKAHKTKIIWDEALLMALKQPIHAFIWLIGLCMALKLTTNISQSPMLLMLPNLRKLGLLIISTWFAVRFIRNGQILYINACEQRQKEVDKTLIHASGQLLIIAVVITSVLAGMQIFGVPISGLLAFGGIGGAGIAFASKDLIANFFGGLVVYMDRPFKVGDWVRSPDKNIEGVVEYIGWRVTRIRTFDKRPLYVPNGLFLTISVENPSRMTNRRIKTLIGIRYEDASKLESITTAVDKMLREHPDIDTNQTLMVNFVEFSPSALTFMIYTFTKTTNWVKFQAIQQDVYLKVLKIIDNHGAECAFPTQTLHIQSPSTLGTEHEHSR